MPNSIHSLAAKSCKASQGEAQRLTAQQINALLGEVAGWEQSAGQIAKAYSFKNYHEAMAFVNATAWISHREDHHPDLEVGYDKVRVRYSTHSVGGLSEKDFICAAKIDSLFAI